MRSLSGKAALLIAANVIKYVVGFVMPMVLVRLLTKEEYWTYLQRSSGYHFMLRRAVTGRKIEFSNRTGSDPSLKRVY
jgi:hypothetical protein